MSKKLIRLALGCFLIGFVAALAAAPKTPVLTEVEVLRVRVLQLETMLAQAKADTANCIGQLGKVTAILDSAQLTEREKALQREIEGAHPGYSWDPKTGVFTEVP